MQNTASNKHSGKQHYTNTIHTHDYAIEYMLQPLATEWSIPNLMQYGFRIAVDVSDFNDVELTLSIPVRIPTLKIMSALFENDLQTVSFSIFRGEDRFKSESPIVLSESEPEINGHIYLEAVILNKSYLYKYVFSAALKKKERTRPRSKPAPPPRKPTPPPEPPAPKPELTKVSESAQETVQRLKNLEQTTGQLLSAIEGLKSGALPPTVQPETVQAEPVEKSSLPSQAEFDEFREMLRNRFADYARHELEQSKAVVPPELEENPVFKTFQDLRQALAPNNPAVQMLKKTDTGFRLPILKFSADVDETLKKLLAPSQAPEFYDVTIKTFKEFLLGDYFDYLGQWMDSETEPPIEAFNQESAYRRYIFNRYRKRLLGIKSEAAAKAFSEDFLVNELKRIKESLLLEHIDEVEALEMGLRGEIVDLDSVVDSYFIAILQPLGMMVSHQKTGDVSQSFVPRTIQTFDGQSVRTS